MTQISVVSPVFKAEECIAELCARIKTALDPLTSEYEIILVDDRSPDRSWELIKNEASQDERVIGIRLSRNFGQHNAITAGLEVANGRWVVVMDCDLQDPPEQIPALYFKALEGNEIVIAKFEDREDSFVNRKISVLFWSILSWLAGVKFDRTVGNFRIISKTVNQNYLQYREQSRLFGGIILLMGFTTSFVDVHRNKRFAGRTSYTLSKKLRMAIDITIAYSDRPLKISAFAGLILSGASFLAGIAILSLKAFSLVQVSGWVAIMVSVYLLSGLIIANLGVIGYYLSKNFHESKRRPLYLVESSTKNLRVHDS